MLKELLWYLESGCFTNLAAELERSLKKYEEAKKDGLDESSLSPLREDARLLFEDHCIRSGLRTHDNSFINIDAEFFDGNTLNDEAKNKFIKNIVKGHCYQKNLWLYMGTTGLMTVISKAEMAQQGLKYEDYLPIEYKKNNPPKKPLAGKIGKNEVLFYQYSDGTISQEYMPEKAKMQFDRLKGRSEVDFRKGWDPNESVKKNGWYGNWDHTGTWVKFEGKKEARFSGNKNSPVTIELIRTGSTAILYDPGMLLLSSPLFMYITESGEPYGNLELDREKTLTSIRQTLKTMGISGISAVGGINTEHPETLEAYKEVLKELAAPGIEAVDHETVRLVRETHEAEAAAKAAEKSGVELERKLSAAARSGGGSAAIVASVASGTVVVPLSPRKKSDMQALGLNDEEAAAISTLPVCAENAAAYDTILSNVYAAWAYYEGGGVSKAELAALVNEYLEIRPAVAKQAKRIGQVKKESPVINAQTSLAAIIHGEERATREGIITYTSGIPGVFSEPELVDFYDETAKEKYLKTLERKRVLPKGGAEAALAALKEMPQAAVEQKTKLNKGLSRTLGQYKAIAMSMGMPLAELIEAVKAETGLGKGTAQTVQGKKVYYELTVEYIMAEAKGENRQKREASLEEENEKIAGSAIIVIGGVHGPALDEIVFTREKLMSDYGFSTGEAAKAGVFLHSIKLAGETPVALEFLAEAVANDKATTAEGLRRSIIKALDAHAGAAYNLSTNEGMQAYSQSSRAAATIITPNDIQELLRENNIRQNIPIPQSLYARLEPKYKTAGDTVTFSRKTPRGSPEKIQFAGVSGGYSAASGIVFNEAAFTDVLYSSDTGILPTQGTSAIVIEKDALLFAGTESPLTKTMDGMVGEQFIIAGDNFAPMPMLPVAPKAPISFHMQQSGSAGIETVPFNVRPIKAEQYLQQEGSVAIKPQQLERRPVNGLGEKAAAITEYGSLFKTMPSLQSQTDATGLSAPMSENQAVAISPSAQQAKDVELEQLRKVTANYKKDKAELNKQKQSALVRSETHDVGHAKGTDDGSLGRQEERNLVLDYKKMAKGNLLNKGSK